MSQKSNSSLKQQLAALDEILDWFDQPDIDLDEALKKFDEGVRLADEAKHKIVQLENKITILKQKFDQPQ